MSKVVVIGVSLAAGLGLGVFLDRNLQDTPHSSTASEVTADGIDPSAPFRGVVATTGSAVTFDVEPMRAMVREELAAALSKLAAGTAQAGSPTIAAEVNSISPEQRQEAIQAVDGLIASGNWGNEERNTFHQKLGQMNPQQREAAMQQLVQAINGGSLKVSTRGAPF